jgi:hemerythrin-like domain-containing protein
MVELTTQEGCTPNTHQPRLVPHPVNRWHSDHANFARLLDLLEQQIDAMHRGGRPDYELMGSIAHYLRHHPDVFHHAREDVAFARVVEHDPRLQLQIARRMQEHVVIAAAGDELLKCLSEAAGAIASRKALETAAATYVVYYRHHLAVEERDVIPRAMELLNAEDWKAVAAIPAEPDPVFGGGSDLRYSGLRKRIADLP